MNCMERGAVSWTFGFLRLQCCGSQNHVLLSPASGVPPANCSSPQIRKPHVANPRLWLKVMGWVRGRGGLQGQAPEQPVSLWPSEEAASLEESRGGVRAELTARGGRTLCNICKSTSKYQQINISKDSKSPIHQGCCSSILSYLSLRQTKWHITKSQIIFNIFSIYSVSSLICSDVYSFPVYIKSNSPNCKLMSPLSLISSWKLKRLIK